MYKNSLEYIEKKKDIVDTLYNILINQDRISTVTHTLAILFLICNFLAAEGVKIVYSAADTYARLNNKKIFSEIVNFLNDRNIDAKTNTLTLICLMLKNAQDKNLVYFFTN